LDLFIPQTAAYKVKREVGSFWVWLFDSKSGLLNRVNCGFSSKKWSNSLGACCLLPWFFWLKVFHPKPHSTY
jgi:hypothetical protein